MKALTIIQPWATLIASGHKMNETRSWKTNYRGEVLIHAGKNPKDYTSGCYIDDPDGRHFQEARITPNNFEDLPRGSIIGKATLVKLACPNCGQSAIANPFRKDREIYPYCPWCGQKLKEAEDEQTE